MSDSKPPLRRRTEPKERMKYRDRNRKQIELPSGATIVIAKLNVFNEPFITPGKKDEAETQGMKLSMFALTNPNNGPFTYNGEEARLVNKPVAGPGEITIGEIDQADADAIINAVVEFSGLTKGASEARKTFPEGPAQDDQPAPAGDALRGIADGAVKAAAG